MQDLENLLILNYSISGTVGETTLKIEQIASHQHTQDTEGILQRYGSYRRQKAWSADGRESNNNFCTVATGGSQAHTHTLSGTKSTSASSFPPYYALSYIMRIA